LFITDTNESAGLMKNQPNTPTKDDVPLVTDAAQFEFPFGSRPSNNRGVTAADFDHDGNIDLFVSSQLSPKLYRNTGSSPAFVDFTDSIGGAFTLFADSSWCGAWGDYDRDGDLDLYVGRAAGSGDQVGGPLRDAIFRNNGNKSFTYTSYTTGLSQNPEVSTTTATWADLTATVTSTSSWEPEERARRARSSSSS
jgi:FG-GAP-like repeat